MSVLNLSSLARLAGVNSLRLGFSSSGLWRPLSFSAQVPHFSQQHQQERGMAVWVDIDNNNLEKGLGQFNRKIRESGLQEELLDRRHHRNKSLRRFERDRASYNRRVGKVINERLVWLQRRKRIKF